MPRAWSGSQQRVVAVGGRLLMQADDLRAIRAEASGLTTFAPEGCVSATGSRFPQQRCSVLTGEPSLVEHQFDMDNLNTSPVLVHRTAHIRLRLTRRQTDRCYGLLRSAGDIWAWLLDLNRQRRQQDALPVVGYPALCRKLTAVGSFGELSVVGARSVLRRYADA
jgi:hypothetical protein